MSSQKTMDLEPLSTMSRKESDQQPTAQSASNSSNTNRLRRKRGVSLSKQHSINFDRMYNAKDLHNEPINVQTYGQKSKATQNSSSKPKLNLQTVRSEKQLHAEMNTQKPLNSRITLGKHEKGGYRVQNEHETQTKHQHKYGRVEQKIINQRKRQEKMAEYGIIRRF